MQPPEDCREAPAPLAQRDGEASPPEPQTVVLLGASVRAAAESALRAKYRVIGLDYFGDRDTRQACDLWFSLADYPSPSQQYHLKRLLSAHPVMRVGGLASHSPLLRWLVETRLLAPSFAPAQPTASTTESSHNSLAMPGGVCDCKDPQTLQQWARAAGMCFPACREPARRNLDEKPEQASTGQAGKPNSQAVRWLWKTRESSGGLGIHWAGDEESASNPGYYQQWISGRPHGAVLLANDGDIQLLGVCRNHTRRLKGHPFVYAGSRGPIAVDARLESVLKTVARHACRWDGYAGLLNVDFLLDRGGQSWLLEVNRRWSASCEVVEAALGVPLMQLALAPRAIDVTGLRPDDRSLRYWKRIVFARRERCIRVSRLQSFLHPDESLHDLPEDGRIIRGGEPICTVMKKWRPMQGESPARRLRQLVRILEYG